MGNIEKLLKGRSRTTWFGRVLILSVCLISALMIGQAQAGDILSLFKEGTNQGSDENSEYLIDRVGNVKGQIDVGDSLRGIVGINTLNSSNANVGGTTGNNEWTGVYQIKVVSKEEIGETGSGAWKFTFEPDPDFEEDLSGGIGSLNGFVPGDGAIVVMFEGSPNNFALGFNDPLPSTPPDGPDDGTTVQTVPPSSEDVSVGPYVIEEQFVALAVDGEYFWTLGFAGEPGEGFEVTAPTGDNILFSFGITSGSVILGFNAGLTRLFNGNHGTGDTVSIAPITTSPFEGGTVEFAVSGSGRGVFDLDTPFEVSTNLNLSFNVQEEEVPGECRMTGGNVTVLPVFDIYGDETWTYKFNNLIKDKDNRITTGGQINTPSGNDPPSGHWTHTHHAAQHGDMSFTFHSGTSSAPLGTQISTVACADQGWCVQARCAPFKQIFWTGIGNFTSKGFNGSALGSSVVPYSNKGGGTLHFYRAMVADFGDNKPTKKASLGECTWPAGGSPVPFNASEAVPINSEPDDPKPDGFGDKGGQVCENCPDYYQIEIYSTDDPTENGVIYEFHGFVGGGNYQIHPETGEQCPPKLAP